MRLCVDIDGVICEFWRENQNYFDLKLIQDEVDAVKQLQFQGHYIILHTARHMKTTQANLGSVIARQGKVTLDWLDKYNIEFDEIYFGQPCANVYDDDLAKRFISWEQISMEIQN